MKVTISNIAWQPEYDAEMYAFLNEKQCIGIEIAPTRIFPDDPYSNLDKVANFKKEIQTQYNLEVVSMQSICFGRNEAIFSNEEERDVLKTYIKKAIDFASVLGCNNLVFGSPKNRIISEGQEAIAIQFFSELGQYAFEKNTVFALEPNPVIYGTNFINTTKEALDFVKACNVEGLKVNFDLGTVIYNNEDISILTNTLQWVNHIHISEPYLEVIQQRNIHKELASLLQQENYTNSISIEMKNGSTMEKIKDTFQYIQDVFKK